jgi:hypothetical protein
MPLPAGEGLGAGRELGLHEELGSLRKANYGGRHGGRGGRLIHWRTLPLVQQPFWHRHRHAGQYYYGELVQV